MEPIKNKKQLEGLLDKIIKSFVAAKVPEKSFKKRSEYIENEGKLEGFSSFKVVFDTTIYDSIVAFLEKTLEKTGMKEAMDNGELNANYYIHDLGDIIGLSSLDFILEVNKGDYKKMTESNISIAEENDFFGAKDPRTLYMEEKEEDSRINLYRAGRHI